MYALHNQKQQTKTRHSPVTNVYKECLGFLKQKSEISK